MAGTDALTAIDEGNVGDWMAANVPDSTAPFVFEPIVGGGSNLTFRVFDADRRHWALRRPPMGQILATAHDMGREVRIMAALATSPVPVPVIIGLCEDPDVTGAPFYVMEFVEGHVIRDKASTEGMTRDEANTATNALIDTQIALHTLDLEACGLSDLAKHGDYVGRQLARWKRQVDQANARDLPLVADLHERLVKHKPQERVAPGLAHGDYRFDNVVLDERFQMAAVLDWELCTIGDPIADFAWSLEYWSNGDEDLTFLPDPPTASGLFVSREEVVDRYRSRCGFELGDLAYYRVFSWWKQACIAEGAYARQLGAARRGQLSKDPADTACHVDGLLQYAEELARGVL